MAYTITKSDGTTLTTINDGGLDTVASSLQLPGPNFVGYGQKLNENLVYLLENFASNTAPSGTNLQGQLWFNKSNQTLNVFTNQGYLPVNGIIISGIMPTNVNAGNTWFDTSTNQFFLFDGTTWNLIGPQYTKGQGISGAIPTVLSDAVLVGTTHNVLQLQYGSTIFAIISGDPAFQPTPSVTGFPTINTGITLNNTISNPVINTSVLGNLTGNVTGNLIGTTVVANTLAGNLTGNVVGNLVGNVVATTASATTFTGALVGNITSTSASISKLLSSNAQITGGSVTGLDALQTNLFTTGAITGTTALFTGAVTSVNSVLNGAPTATTATPGTNTSQIATTAFVQSAITAATTPLGTMSTQNAGNVLISGGSAQNLTTVSATTGSITNLTATNQSVTTFSTTNLLTGNALITGGNINGVINFSATNLTATKSIVGTEVVTNFSTGNALITGGNITGATSISATSGAFTNIVTGAITVTGGNISGTAVSNTTLSNVTVVNSTATTKTYSDNSTAIATTAFVQNSVPAGVIWMWNNITNPIPTGFQLCDGSNGTPDLRDRFVVGAGGLLSSGATGGTALTILTTGNLPSHAHAVSLTGTSATGGGHSHTAVSTSTVSDPTHAHIFPGDDQLAFAAGYAGWAGASAGGFPYDAVSQHAGGGQLWYTTEAATGITVSTATTISSVGDHTHGVTLTGNTNPTGSGSAFENRPPYYALCFIQKMF
jgi:hypothetical protein